MRDVAKLPKWAQALLESKDQELRLVQEQMESLKAAHAVLFGRGSWFAIHGPPDDALARDGKYSLFFLGYNGAHPACTLRKGDVLLCGRQERKA